MGRKKEYLIGEIYYMVDEDEGQFKIVFYEEYLRGLIKVAKEDKDAVLEHIKALKEIDLGNSLAILLEKMCMGED
ncbi:hypothetical protein [Methanocaldococcus sp.]|uniref:hypothetical protein n=1 Tax=Methanocaldococcus sp. TaxID=2152917 RepID=UPI00262A44A3|nr:hypothetical protein [Methanocaldococcus sp.]MCQ6254745.1 hypothetical protein [Methanocaldococcus sp.]